MPGGRILEAEDQLDFKRNREIICKDQLDVFLREYFKQDICDEITEIVEQCFSKGADIAFIFLNKSNGDYSTACFQPVVFDKIKVKAISVMDGIGRVITLSGRFIEEFDQVLPDSIAVSLIHTAEKKGYWRGVYAFGVSNKEWNSK